MAARSAVAPATVTADDVALAVADIVPDSAAVEAACEEALVDKVADLTIPGANTAYLASLAAIEAKVAAPLIPRADLSVAAVTVGSGANVDLVAAVGGQSVKVYGFEVRVPSGAEGNVSFFDGAAADIGGSATPLHSGSQFINAADTWAWVAPSPRWNTSAGKGLSISNSGAAGSIYVTVLYKQEA